MNKPTYFLRVLVETLPRLVGLDVFIEGTDYKKFSSEVHSSGCREFWGFGLHVVVSTLRKAPRVRS